MKAGLTNLEVGTRVKIENVKGEDAILNGLEGTLTHPFAFGCTDKNWVGVWLDDKENPYGENCNVRVSEIKLINKIYFTTPI